ncbi:endolytic transglycosylase MltG [Thermomonas hydrothermalis]|uniref:Endolytic murein transglycosylase n=1 Tax=Thermomonas hydrothermalis TaxID=213588 RepID=A0A1M4Y151_9GAMM|nr:endolytic transglycosylase MltG [Thermomonas hydrothermalis]SHE99544.1 UPF0755 protein [Thermomonas hydrothermalis]
MKRMRTRLALLGVLVAMALVWQGVQLARFANTPLRGMSTDASVVLPRGGTLTGVVRALRAQGVEPGPAWYWPLLARLTGVAGHLQAGEYALPPGITPRALLQAMRDGKVLQRRFTIVEGWTVRDLRAALARVPLLRQETAGMDEAALMAALGAPGQPAEGRFLPETYAWVRGDSDLDLLRRAHAAMQRALDEAWRTRADGLPLRTPTEALILASIVEKETGVAEERAKIAGVFIRRLQRGMRLQTDPTVIYGMGPRYAGNLRRIDLMTDTPYNTYTREGLPPTPIALPGKAALHAVTHPEPGDALYFVALGDGSGRHVFSRTLDEHNAAVRTYLQRLRAQRETGNPGETKQ